MDNNMSNSAIDSNGVHGEQATPRPFCEGGNTPLDFFALVIGINAYQRVPKLGGAAPDADRFEVFLRRELVSLSGGIKSLRDEQATRSAIIQELSAIKDNERIVKDRTAVVIYYAGHGARAQKPAEWTDWQTADGSIEMLCPVDADTTTLDGAKVEAIPDRTISYLLRDLSRAKGNNITLIFDCCHSAGLNRGETTDPHVIVRGLDDILTISVESDSQIVSPERSRSTREGESSNEVHEGFCAAWDSHVLLAACSRGQTACERDNQGDFTSALLDVLESVPIGNLTYKSLMERLRMPSNSDQTPHLDGKHINRRLFMLSGEAMANSVIRCDYQDVVDGQPRFSLRAGYIQSITLGSIYDIYDTDLPTSPALVTMKVVSVAPKTSLLEMMAVSEKYKEYIQQSRANVWYARLSIASGHELLAYCDDPALRARLFSEDGKLANIKYPGRRVDSRDKADICLDVDGPNRVLFSRGGVNSFFKEEACSFGPMRQNRLWQSIPNLPPHFSFKPRVSDIDAIKEFLDSYAHFTLHATMQSRKDIRDLVSIEMFKLKRDGNELSVGSKNLLPVPGKKEPVQTVEIVAAVGSLYEARYNDDIPRYGLTIESRSNAKLYPHILGFDPSTLEIDVMYSNMTANNDKMWQNTRAGQLQVDTCLEMGSKVNFGLTDDMVSPLLFCMSPEQEVDISFIKIFMTTEPVDLRCILQPSIEESLQRGARAPVSGPILEWASMTIPLVLVARQSDDGKLDEVIASCSSDVLLNIQLECPSTDGDDGVIRTLPEAHLEDRSTDSEPESRMTIACRPIQNFFAYFLALLYALLRSHF
ncbi:hypothetical protein ARMGADRAFT_974216 [Armillaria gallica]|uniref:Peptidase C14 caspase domain-containing protein n=1 Tax=Armillaria gallica TaxID=47427 RepID=A0A2H3D626_ARMGA|nr:hypothetical protein ARMGADRAFT_974216 [Armillaria gallica]